MGGRSTKAGIETPATQSPRGSVRIDRSCAQRRPGSRPRRHTSRVFLPPVVAVAQRRPGSRPRRHFVVQVSQRVDHRRSTKAGIETPATPEHCQECESSRWGPLNEGRDRDPGDTPAGGIQRQHACRRSTKAGIETPATLPCGDAGHRGAVRRSTKAGIETPATPDHLAWARGRSQRSTKAGIETPATQYEPPEPSWVNAPLNEGRDRDPGDTAPNGTVWLSRADAQRRPGSRPRRHRLGERDVHLFTGRSTKAGIETPATRPCRADGCGVPGARSTKAGIETPATLSLPNG